MPHYKLLLDPSIFLGAQDFQTDKTVKISRIAREKMPERDGDKEQAGVMLYFTHGGKELERKYKLAKSVMYGLSLIYGVNTDDWLGKDITLFAARCISFGEVVECVRVRFPPDIDAKIGKWMKKRKASPSAYMIVDRE